MRELAPNVYVALAPPGHEGAANAGFVVLDDAVLVVDTHMVPAAARELLGAIRRVTTLPVRYVVNTHWHPDHTRGNEAYAELSPRPLFLSHEMTRRDIATLGAARLKRDLEASTPGPKRAELRALDLVLPNLTFSRTLRLRPGGREIHLLYFGRGHTRGDTVVFLPSERIAFVGDLVTGGPPFARDGYPFAWRQTLRALLALDAEWVVSGHGQVRRGMEIVSDRIRFLDHALAVIEADARRGDSVEATAREIDLDRFRDTFEPEPANHPWGGWVRTLVERALLELSAGDPMRE